MMPGQPNCYIDSDGRVACDDVVAVPDEPTIMQNPARTTLGQPVGVPSRAPARAALPSGKPLGPARGAPQKTLPTRRPRPGTDECCVHVQTSSLESITPDSPALGRLDCPTMPEYHEREVEVLDVAPDNQGGMVAMIRADWHAVETVRDPKAPGRLLAVCTAGPQDQPPVECCLTTGIPGTPPTVSCADPTHPMHGQPAEVAIARGYTLEVCPPPTDLVDCCVELGNFVDDAGRPYTGRLDCDDESLPWHGKLVDAAASEDGLSATIRVGEDLSVRLPVCIKETVPEEIPCCVRNGRLHCPEYPDYHGMPIERARQAGLEFEACPAERPSPEEPPPPDCCVSLQDDGSAVLLCSNLDSPYHGYALDREEFQCIETPQGMICSVSLTNGFSARLPVCDAPPAPEPLPPDCCYDLAAGALSCPSDPGSEWDGLKVSLENLQSGGPGQPTTAVVSHAKLGSAPVGFPVCEMPVPPDCCFEAAERGAGAVGKLRCPSTPALDGLSAVLVDINKDPAGGLIASVSWAGGGARLPFCRVPEEEEPDLPPPYFCCVNAETGLYVCPAQPQRDGQPAAIREEVQINGFPWFRVEDGQLVPACGSICPAPEPCPRAEECPPCPSAEPCPPCPTAKPCPPTPACPTQPCSQPPWGEFFAHPVGFVPRAPGCVPC